VLCCFHGGTEFASEFHLFFPPLLLSAVTSVSFGWVHRIGTSVSSYLRCKSALLPFHCHSIAIRCKAVELRKSQVDRSGRPYRRICRWCQQRHRVSLGVLFGCPAQDSHGKLPESLLSRCWVVVKESQIETIKNSKTSDSHRIFSGLSFDLIRGAQRRCSGLHSRSFQRVSRLMSDAVWCCLMLSDAVWCCLMVSDVLVHPLESVITSILFLKTCDLNQKNVSQVQCCSLQCAEWRKTVTYRWCLNKKSEYIYVYTHTYFYLSYTYIFLSTCINIIKYIYIYV